VEAARLHVLGVNCIPVGRDKRPLGAWKRWQQERQVELPHPDDDEYILEHFDRNVNLGAITGAVSEIVVLDADSRVAWDALVAACGGSIPRTVITNTAKGRHVWFAHPGGEIRNTVRLGGVPLDARGDGGFVVVPPSIHPSGKPYTWGRSPMEHWPPAQMPQPLLDLLRPAVTARAVGPVRVPARGTGSRYAEAALKSEAEAVRGSTEGNRNDTLNRAAFALSRFVISGDLKAVDVWHALMYAARAVGLSETEAERTIGSAFGARAS
jgi:hypothetical protein